MASQNELVEMIARLPCTMRCKKSNSKIAKDTRAAIASTRGGVDHQDSDCVQMAIEVGALYFLNNLTKVSGSVQYITPASALVVE